MKKKLAMILILIIVCVPILNVIASDEGKGKGKAKGKAKGKGHDDQENETVDISLFTNSLELGQNLPVPGFEMLIYADLVYQETITSNELGEFTFTFEWGVSYTYEMALFGSSDYLTGTLTAGEMSIEIPSFHLTMTLLDADTLLPLSNFDLWFGMEYLGVEYTTPVLFTTDVNGEIIFTQALHGMLVYGLSASTMIYEVVPSIGFKQLNTLPTETKTLYLSRESFIVLSLLKRVLGHSYIS